MANQSKEAIEKQEPKLREWVCKTKCYCSDDDNPLRSRLWRVGESTFAIKKPSKHFVTRENYTEGTDGKNRYLAKIKRLGGQLTPDVRSLPIEGLKILCNQLEREFLRRQATQS